MKQDKYYSTANIGTTSNIQHIILYTKEIASLGIL